MVNHSGKLFFAINSLNGGGAERVISNLGNYFFNRGFDVTMVCLNDAQPAYFLDPGIKVISLVNTTRNQQFIYRIWYVGLTFFKLLHLLIKERPRIVVSFMVSANLWTGLTCNLLRIPYLVSERITPDYTINQFNYFLSYLSSVIYGKSKAIIVPSKGMIAGFRKNKSFRSLNNFEVINNPVNNFSAPSATRVHRRKFILGVGRLEPQKGFDLLISAFKELETQEIDLLISGEGNERKNLENLIQSMNLSDRVKLIGFKENLQDYYQQAEIFVLSSRNEGYPNALLEAMSFGCACVTTDCEFGPSDIIENEQNCLLVKANSIKHLTEGMNRVLSDLLLKQRIANNAQLIKQTNSAENTSAKWEKLLLSHL